MNHEKLSVPNTGYRAQVSLSGNPVAVMTGSVLGISEKLAHRSQSPPPQLKNHVRENDAKILPQLNHKPGSLFRSLPLSHSSFLKSGATGSPGQLTLSNSQLQAEQKSRQWVKGSYTCTCPKLPLCSQPPHSAAHWFPMWPLGIRGTDGILYSGMNEPLPLHYRRSPFQRAVSTQPEHCLSESSPPWTKR